MEPAPSPLQDQSPERDETLEEIRQGLRARQKWIPTKLLYDARGSALFERICELDEYYLTRTELAILREHGPDMARELGRRCMLIEFGSGSGIKTERLLELLEAPVAYVPIDISSAALAAASAALARRFPTLRVLPIHADYNAPIDLPATDPPPKRRVVFFPGSTIGNFREPGAPEFLARVRRACGPGGGLLVGVDLHKDAATLEAAYDDPGGVTAEFELNALRHLNRDYAGDFALDAFDYQARYNSEQMRVEMALVSRRAQRVRVAGLQVTLDAGERILTEYSHKYTLDGFAAHAARAGFRVGRVWVDPDRRFSVQYLHVAPTA